jgi:DNA-binding response OmpR family regulator
MDMSKTARIVIAEDDPHILQLLEHVLSVDGHQVATAKDGEEGLELVKKIRPDLLITDVMMPRRNGYQLVHSVLNETQDLPTPKIIILTSRTDPSDVKRGLTVGADVYIAKPFDIQEVTGHVRELLASAG